MRPCGRGPSGRTGGDRATASAVLLLGFLLFVVLVVFVRAEPSATGGGAARRRGHRRPVGRRQSRSRPPSPYAGVGTWLSRYRITREFGGAAPPVTPEDVDAMADAGVRTLYLQPAADDPRYPGLLSTDLLGEFLVRAHARDMQVVAWYLPRFGDIAGDLRRLQEIAAFRVDGQGSTRSRSTSSSPTRSSSHPGTRR